MNIISSRPCSDPESEHQKIEHKETQKNSEHLQDFHPDTLKL